MILKKMNFFILYCISYSIKSMITNKYEELLTSIIYHPRINAIICDCSKRQLQYNLMYVINHAKVLINTQRPIKEYMKLVINLCNSIINRTDTNKCFTDIFNYLNLAYHFNNYIDLITENINTISDYFNGTLVSRRINILIYHCYVNYNIDPYRIYRVNNMYNTLRREYNRTISNIISV